MTRKILSYLSYVALIIGATIGGYVLLNIYVLNSSLPEDVCPVTNNEPLIYTAIALCGISFILSFFEPKAKEVEESTEK